MKDLFAPLQDLTSMSDAVADFVKLDIFGVVHLAVSVAADLSVLHGWLLLTCGSAFPGCSKCFLLFQKCSASTFNQHTSLSSLTCLRARSSRSSSSRVRKTASTSAISCTS